MVILSTKIFKTLFYRYPAPGCGVLLTYVSIKGNVYILGQRLVQYDAGIKLSGSFFKDIVGISAACAEVISHYSVYIGLIKGFAVYTLDGDSSYLFRRKIR